MTQNEGVAIAMLLVAIFFVSGADAASIVMATMATRGSLEPPRIVVLVLGVLMGAGDVAVGRELELAVLERELRQRVNLCPSCRSVVEKEYLLCPECAWDLKKPCENCQKPLHLGWSTCPYCATVQSEKNVNW